jgi:CheY-like chemotaxis protein
MNTLIIEDDPSQAEIIAAIAAHNGHKTTIACTAEEGQQLYSQHTHPLIILDLHLPGMNGHDFSKWLRNQPSSEKTYILVSTSDNRESTWKEALKNGANSMFFKPITAPALSIGLRVAQKYLHTLATQPKESHQITRSTSERVLVITLEHPTPVESWNFETVILPAKTRIEINNPYTPLSRVITTVDENGTAKPILIPRSPTQSTDYGFRFIIDNNPLHDALITHISKTS